MRNSPVGSRLALDRRRADIHLPRRLGEALKRAFHGALDMHFDQAGYFVRVDWQPPA